MERSDKVDPYDKPTYETCEKITVDSNTFIDHCALCFGSYFIQRAKVFIKIQEMYLIKKRFGPIGIFLLKICPNIGVFISPGMSGMATQAFRD